MNEHAVGKTVRTVGLMMGATVIAKLLGLLRSVWLAGLYGAGMEAEAFSAASRLTLTLFDVILGAAVAVCFIPVYNQEMVNGERPARRFADAFISLVVLLTSAVAALGMLCAGGVIALLAPGLETQTAQLAASLLRYMLPMMIFSGLAACWTGVLQSHGRFLLPAVMSAVSNALILVYFWLFNGRFGIRGLAVAYLLAWMLQCLVLLPGLSAVRFRFCPSLHFGGRAMRTAYRLAPQAMISSWLTPVMTAVGLLFASLIPYESVRPVPCLEYANQLLLITSGVLVYAVCNYVFPSLSKLKAVGDEDRFRDTVRAALCSALFIVIPVAALLVSLSPQAVNVVFRRGEFSFQAAVLTAGALSKLAPAMIAMTVTELLNRAFFARQTGRVPTAASLAGMIVFAGACALTVPGLKLGLSGIAWATVAGQLTSATVLVVSMRRADRRFFDRAFIREILKMLLSGIGCLTAAETVKRLLMAGLADNFTGNLLTGAVSATAGMAVFIGMARLLRCGPLMTLLRGTSLSSSAEGNS